MYPSAAHLRNGNVYTSSHSEMILLCDASMAMLKCVAYGYMALHHITKEKDTLKILKCLICSRKRLIFVYPTHPIKKRLKPNILGGED